MGLEKAHRVSMIVCSVLFEAWRPEVGGRDFDRRLLLMLPSPPLPEDDFDILSAKNDFRELSGLTTTFDSA